jgi:hypothetical protein
MLSHRPGMTVRGSAMTLPNWLGIPGAILLIGMIVYGFRQGTKVTTKQEGDPPERGGSLL